MSTFQSHIVSYIVAAEEAKQSHMGDPTADKTVHTSA